jgi:hypothetical protein
MNAIIIEVCSVQDRKMRKDDGGDSGENDAEQNIRLEVMMIELFWNLCV